MSRRFLLLQARAPDDPMLQAERKSFARSAGVGLTEITTHNLADGPVPAARVREFEALLIGGAGEFYVSRRDLPQFDRLLDLLRELVEVGHPTFASCFGFQCLVAALGGEVAHDPERAEVGTYELQLTAEGRQDELLGILPPRFNAQLGRKDRALRLPAGCVNLAASRDCLLQAFRIPDLPIWATQFHPELTGEENRARYLRYLDGYAVHLTREEREEALKRYAESPETERLIAQFSRLVCGGSRAGQ